MSRLKHYAPLLYLIAIVVLAGIFINATKDADTDPEYEAKRLESYGVYALQIPENVTMAGERIPMTDPEVYERFDRELLVNTYWQSNSLLMFKRAARYFPVIEPILKEEGVPEDFKYLAVIESGLMNVVSPAGATGFWQIMKNTAPDYGLEVNNDVDERYHLEKSTRAACKYLKQAKKKFGTWTMAAASYNMGMAGLERQLNRQKEKDYFDLTLNSETARYVLRIAAMKEIMENPKTYGFHFRQKDLYQPIAVQYLTVDSSIVHLGDFAHRYGISYKTLKYHNPWLREVSLPNPQKKTYHIAIPLAKGEKEYEAEEFE